MGNYNYEFAGTLPANEDSERFVLGSIILDEVCYHQAVAAIAADDFSLDSNRRIFLRMRELVEVGQPIDFNTLTEQLGKHREIEMVGGTAYVMALTDGLPRVKNIQAYLRIVKEKATLRGIIHRSSGAINAAAEGQAAPSNIIGQAIEDLIQLQTGVGGKTQKVSEFSDDVIRKMKAEWEGNREQDRYTCGLRGLTENLGGMIEEEYWVLMGRTGDGKTGLACQIAIENAFAGRPVLLIPLELSRDLTYRRLICSVARVSNEVVIKRKFWPTEGEKARIMLAKKTLDEAPLYIEDCQQLTAVELIARARLAIRRHNVGLTVIDYMQKIREPRYREMRQRMTAVSDSLRLLARNEKSRVLALSQMGRPEGKNINQRPTMFDPKECGDIENDVHALFSTYRPRDEHQRHTHEDEIPFLKIRDGSDLFSQRAEYQGQFYRWEMRQ